MMLTLPPSSGAPLRIAPPTNSATVTTAPFGRAWRLGVALLLVAGVLVFGAAVSTRTAFAAPICATPPLTGTTTISGSVNTFYPGLTTALAAGQANTTVNVGAGTGAPTPLAVGDLAVVIQMQGAAIDATNTGAYGDGIAGNPAAGVLAGSTAGRYEFVRVASVVGSMIGLEGSGANGGLEFGYANANATTTAGQQRYQIVRVPQYSGATLSATTPPTTPAWNGSTGGLLVLDVAANLNLNGAMIDSTGRGFRPGLQRARRGSAVAGLTNTDTRTATALALNGQKGEGIAGTPRWRTGDLDTVGDGYPNGDFGRGAPGNAGGGGTDGRPTANDQNSGGGGGGNGGTGGQGGNSWSSNLAVGGFGGAGVATTIDRIVLGGGGGAGSDNDAVLSSSGGAGGGIVLVRSGSMTGTGTITADGAPGSISGQDGAGGAGAGGTVVVVTTASGAASGFAGLTINARGGRGGDETNASPHGPGGGGGGGRVFTSVAPLAANVSGGANGIHSGVAYGATPGSSGSASLTAVTSVPGANAGANCIDLAVTKTVSPSPVVPGQSVTYTVTATNRGPFPRTGTAAVLVTDSVPGDLSSVGWTCTASAGSSCDASGSGSLSTTAQLAVGGTATYTITGTLSPSFTGTLENTATVTPPNGTPELTPLDNNATAGVDAAPHADLSITKTDDVATATPGTNVTYTIVASNAGPSAVTAAPITDPLPVGATGGTWTCAAGAGASCGAASGSMPLTTTASMAPSSNVTYTAIVAVSPTATGSLVNTATISAPAGVVETNSGNNTDTDTDTLTPTGDLSISKTDGLTTVDASTALTYTIVARNSGSSTIVGATVADTLPAQLTNATWTCVASVTGSSCPTTGTGNIDASVTLVSGGIATFTVTATVAATATGTISNTATITSPGGFTDPTPGNNSVTDTTSITRRADLQITKDDNQTTVAPGQSVTYTITASNPTGPSAVTGAIVSDVLPASLSGATWSCLAAGSGSSCPASGAGNLNATVSLGVGGTATFTVTATIAPGATGNLVNTAEITVPGGVTELDTTNNSDTDTSTLLPEADLQITKNDGVSFAVPGRDVSYTIVATNAGPFDVPGAIVSDPLAPGLTGARWTCSATGAARCGNTTGNGAVNVPVDLPVGDTVEFVVTARLDPVARGVLTNTATISTPVGITETSPGDNSATDINTITPIADLSITKTDGRTDAVPGDTIAYVIVVSNAGPAAVVAAPVTDVIPIELTAASWTCASAAGSACAAAGGADDIRTTVDLAVGSTATFTVTATVASTVAGTVANSATIDAPAGVSDPNPGGNAASDSTTISPLADASITKTDGLTTIVAGAVTTYTIVVTNPGPSGLVGVAVDDMLPTALLNAAWTCSTTGGAVCGDAAGTGSIDQLVDLPAGSTATYTVTATVVASASGTISNTATITLPSGVVDPTPANNTDTDITTVTGVADLAVTKTNGVSMLVAGRSVTYDIVVSNAGPSDAIGASVTDFLPTSLINATWTCASSDGATCAVPSGSVDIDVVIDVPSGATVDLVVTATVAPGATGQLANTATVAPAAGTTDPNPSDNADTDTDSLTSQVDLTVTKTDGTNTATPGTTTTYTIVVTNSGPSTATGATVLDPLPVGVAGASWTCVAADGASCATAAGTGSIATTVTLAPASSVGFVVVASIDPWARGTLTNVATALAPTGSTETTPGDNVATDIDDLTPVVDLAITNTDGRTAVSPRDVLTYIVVVTNNGPAGVIGASFTDLLPDSLTGVTWTCAAAPGSSCGSPSGTGSIDSSIDVAVGGTVTFTVVATVADSATGQIASTATVTPPLGTTDANPADNSAVDTDDVATLFALSITKVAERTDVAPGSLLGFTIVVSNAGPSSAEDVTVVDRMPAGLSPVSWTCAGVGGASCGAASGAGSPTVLVEIPAGGAITIGVQTVVSADPAVATDIVNVAVASVASSANSTATETTASAMVRMTPQAPAQSIVVEPRLPSPMTPQPPTTSATTPQVTLPSTGSDVTPTPATPATSVPNPLPSTGSEIAGILLIAGVTALAGVSLLAVGRQRRRDAT